MLSAFLLNVTSNNKPDGELGQGHKSGAAVFRGRKARLFAPMDIIYSQVSGGSQETKGSVVSLCQYRLIIILT